MKKFIIAAGCVAMTFAMTTLSFGIQLTPEGARTLKSNMDSKYVTEVQGGKILYSQVSTAFRPTELDSILKAYGLTLQTDMASHLPKNYASMKDGRVVLSDEHPTAFTPNEYHAIFTSYGLQLDPACIQSTISRIPYAEKVSGSGQVTLGNVPTAYTGEHYADILYCYNLPAKPVAMQKAHTKWVVASDYLFDFNKAVIKQKYYGKLDQIVDDMKNDPSLKVEVQGYTDSIGSAKYNMKLSQRRANAVRNYLVKKGGISADRITAVGYGETRPVASNKTKEGRAKNRRVEIIPIK